MKAYPRYEVHFELIDQLGKLHELDGISINKFGNTLESIEAHLFSQANALTSLSGEKLSLSDYRIQFLFAEGWPVKVRLTMLIPGFLKPTPEAL